VVVDDFDLPGISIPPFKTNPPLIVDPDTPLPPSIATEFFEAVSGRLGELFDPVNAFNLPELAKGDPFNRGKPAAVEALGDTLGFLVPE
jgi:hypothetical protein